MHQSPAYSHKRHAHEIWNWNSKANSSYTPETMPCIEPRKGKIQHGGQVTILKITLLKIDRLLLIYTSIMPLKFGVDILGQTKVRVQNQKIQYGRQAAVLKVTSLKINRLPPTYTSIVLLGFGVIQKAKMKLQFGKMAARLPFWKWRRWKSIDRFLPLATINLHIKFQIEIPK